VISTLDIATTYIRLSVGEKILFLARLAHKLTICARGTYLPAPDGGNNFERLRAFNELQHRIAGQWLAMLSDSVARPDEDFMKLIMKSFEDLGCADVLVGLLSPQPVP